MELYKTLFRIWDPPGYERLMDIRLPTHGAVYGLPWLVSEVGLLFGLVPIVPFSAQTWCLAGSCRALPQPVLFQDASILSTMLSIAMDRVDGVVGVGGAFTSDLFDAV